jgi:hypothetical protein
MSSFIMQSQFAVLGSRITRSFSASQTILEVDSSSFKSSSRQHKQNASHVCHFSDHFKADIVFCSIAVDLPTFSYVIVRRGNVHRISEQCCSVSTVAP